MDQEDIMEIRIDPVDSYHWHLEICPRTSIPSGFELGSGLFVNNARGPSISFLNF